MQDSDRRLLVTSFFFTVLETGYCPSSSFLLSYVPRTTTSKVTPELNQHVDCPIPVMARRRYNERKAPPPPLLKCAYISGGGGVLSSFVLFALAFVER